jgi:hypothetical protein
VNADISGLNGRIGGGRLHRQAGAKQDQSMNPRLREKAQDDSCCLCHDRSS